MTPPETVWHTAWPALPALLLLVVGLWGLRRRVVWDRRLLAVLGLALLVRVLVIPSWRHVYDGHEADYLDIFLHRSPVDAGGTLRYPALQVLYAGLGAMLPHPAVPVAVAVAFGLVGVAATVGLVGRLTRSETGLQAGVFVALWGPLAFHATSAYNVIQPHALATVALWGLATLGRGGAPVSSSLVAGGAAALAVALRVETVLLAPVGLVLLAITRPRRPWAWLPGLLAGAALGLLAARLVLWTGQAPGSGEYGLALWANAGNLAWLAPGGVWGSATALAVVGVAVWRAPVLGWPALVGLVTLHLVGASFDDYGSRHLLNAAPLVAGCLAAVLGGSRVGLAAVTAWLAVDLAYVARDYYLPEERWAERIAHLGPRLRLDDLAPCARVSEDWRVAPEQGQLSHFNLLNPQEVAALKEEHGCLVWLEDVQDVRWSSRAVRDRAARVRHLYELSFRGVVEDPSRGYVARAWEVGERRVGTVAPFRRVPAPEHSPSEP